MHYKLLLLSAILCKICAKHLCKICEKPFTRGIFPSIPRILRHSALSCRNFIGRYRQYPPELFNIQYRSDSSRTGKIKVAVPFKVELGAPLIQHGIQETGISGYVAGRKWLHASLCTYQIQIIQSG